MYSVGDKIVYGENGVCTIDCIGPLSSNGLRADDRLYYHMTPLVGNGTYFVPVEPPPFMRPVISREEAESLISSIPDIGPAICTDNRFNHVDAFYKEQFKKHTCEALVAVIKGLNIRLKDKKAKSSRAEITLKRAKDMLHGELSVALGMDINDVENYIRGRIGE